MPPKSGTVRMDDAVANAKLAIPPPPAPFTLGSTVGGYRFVSILGQGSFATVYLAEEVLLGRLVALKVCPPDALEGRTIAQLNHENIVRVNSQSPLQGYAIVNMEFVPSVTSESLMKSLNEAGESPTRGSWIQKLEANFKSEAVLTVSEFRTRELLTKSSFPSCVAWFGLQMAEALAHAHAQGILHLDIKPTNILLHQSGKPYLMDFNVAVESSALQSGVPETFGGTFDYMSPEQLAVFFTPDKDAAIKLVGEHSDVCSLGLVLKQFLAATKSSTHEVRDLTAILAKATAKDLKVRYKKAQELVSALEGFLEMNTIRRRLPIPGALARWVARKPVLGLTLFGAVPLILASAESYLYNFSQIVGKLDSIQQASFHEMSFAYGPFFYAGALAFWIWKLRGTHVQSAARAMPTELTATEWRRRVLRIPFWSMIITSAIWLPCIVSFPLVLGRLGSGLSTELYIHLIVSVISSYTIALGYTYIIHSYFVATAIYPSLFTGETDIGKKAKTELLPVVRKLSFFCSVAGSIPIISVLCFIYRSGDLGNESQQMHYRLLITLLIGPGTIGLWFAVGAKERVKALYKQFSSTESSKKPTLKQT